VPPRKPGTKIVTALGHPLVHIGFVVAATALSVEWGQEAEHHAHPSHDHGLRHRLAAA
jgi:hypothetical protein